jgi:hypothetical protein
MVSFQTHIASSLFIFGFERMTSNPVIIIYVVGGLFLALKYFHIHPPSYCPLRISS